jgi:DNA-binding MarR family transcriptional regulator
MRPDQPHRAKRAEATETAYRFGDLLALARADWKARMADGLAARGYPGYRPSDALLIRTLHRRSFTISRLAAQLGISRQAARKLIDGLEGRGYAAETRDDADGRSVNVCLTAAGEAYADAVSAVIDALNRAVAKRVSAADLAVTDAVLRASIANPRLRAAAARVVPPPAPPP